MNYMKQDDDSVYRIVSLATAETGKYEEFVSSEVRIPEWCVLEVRKSDGRETVVCGGGKKTVKYGSHDGVHFYLPAEIPTARLWVRHAGKAGLMYKIPFHLVQDGSQIFLRVPGGTKKAEIAGDRYFEAACSLIKT